MFNALSDKLQGVFDQLGRKGALTEADVDVAMRELRLALLEADVNFAVVREFTERVKVRAIGAEVLKSLSPGQQVVKIVHEELIETLGEPAPLNIGQGKPPVILMAGLQGSGKTTTSAKLALSLRKRGQKPLLVACDTRRPAAIDQLASLGKQLGIDVYTEGDSPEPPDIAERAIEHARSNANTVVIVDTSGRLQIDDVLMDEIEEISRRIQPQETLLVADAMTGQEAVNVAKAFDERLTLTGLVLTKVDGDARGGAALSMRAVTGVPIKFMGMGEKPSALEVFDARRIADRILGMGDVLTLIEKAEAAMDEEEAIRMEKKLRKGRMDLEDFLKQLQQIQKMGPLKDILGMIPGMNKLQKQMPLEVDDKQLKRVEAIILSMTPQERRRPKILNAGRKRRIAAGSGVTVTEVNQLLKQFKQMQKMMKQMSKGRMPNFPGLGGDFMGGMGG